MFGSDQSSKKQKNYGDDQSDDLSYDTQNIEDAAANQPETITPDSPSANPTDPEPSADQNSSWQHPGKPVSSGPISDVASPASGFSGGSSSKSSGHHSSAKDNDNEPGDSSKVNDLIDLRQHVLGELSPLVNHLDQPPEERFHTLMMVIQASDNQDLVKEAYEAANSIKDEKVRAQALLEIVNEINYFTQKAN